MSKNNVRLEQWTVAEQESLASEISMICGNLTHELGDLPMSFIHARRIDEQLKRLGKVAEMLYIPDARPPVYR